MKFFPPFFLPPISTFSLHILSESLLINNIFISLILFSLKFYCEFHYLCKLKASIGTSSTKAKNLSLRLQKSFFQKACFGENMKFSFIFKIYFQTKKGSCIRIPNLAHKTQQKKWSSKQAAPSRSNADTHSILPTDVKDRDTESCTLASMARCWFCTMAVRYVANPPSSRVGNR